MKSVSMLEFRLNAEKIIARVRQGQRLLLTYRGKPVATLEPLRNQAITANDPFFKLAELADAKGESLSNDEINGVVYGR
jgi:prevent-host-death family protein